MSRSRTADEIKRRTASAILTYAFLRIESALTIALTFILIFLFPRPFPWWRWWYWFLLGLIGEALIVFMSVRDEVTARMIVANLLREKINPRQIHSVKHRQRLENALEYHQQIEKVISTREEGVLRTYLENSLVGITDWIANIAQLSRRLDAYENDHLLQRDLQTLPREIEHAEGRLRLEGREAVRQELDRMIASKRAQLRNLEELQSLMQQAELQIENSMAALGTVYSQVLLLDAQEVDSAKGRRIQQDIQDQINALQNIVTTMDEVYSHVP